ncbi:MAG: (5-formylfuran-3-yl)methyl phosphate synthase [Pirellulaceae bacterium]|nr:(5-formylfuran-3-yl)methyl phosphate synthase [Pirellulaceae bacterium]
MTGLLVSVRDLDEARIALAAGVDLIDVKEPRRGSLGAASAEVWRSVVAFVAGRQPVSLALGELVEGIDPERLPSAARANFAKVGLAGMRGDMGWPQRWRAVVENLPAGTRPVAVAYADWQSAGAPSPEEVLEAGAEAGCPYLLVDTYGKSRGNLLAHLSASELHVLAAQARAAGVELVLAGSLDELAITELLPLAPAYIAVRGAVCRGTRSGPIDESKIQQIKNILAAPTLTPSPSPSAAH